MKRKAKIFYISLDDFWRKEEKLEWLRDNPIEKIAFESITPDEKHNWINQTNNDFETLLPMIDKNVKLGRVEEAVFEMFSLGVVTARDEWVYDFNEDALIEKVKYLIDSYNKDLKSFKGKTKDEIKEEIGKREKRDIKWSRAVINDISHQKKFTFNKVAIQGSLYRPFVKASIYFSKELNEMQYQLPYLVNAKKKNLFICYVAGNRLDFSCIATNLLPNYAIYSLDPAQCLPLNRFEKNSDEPVDNITDWGLTQFQTHYGKATKAETRPSGSVSLTKESVPSAKESVSSAKENTLADARVSASTDGARITKRDIFYYTYAVLHSPVYRVKYEQNLKREFPRLPFYEDFFQWRDWGKELMDLHINYETREPFALERKDLDVSAKTKNKAPNLFDDCLKDNNLIASGANPTLDAKNNAVPVGDELSNARSSPSAKEISSDAPDGLHPSLSNSSASPTKTNDNSKFSINTSGGESFVAKPKTKLRADKVNNTIEIDSHTTLTGIPPLAWEYKLGNRSALEWVLDQHKEKTPQDATIRERFDTYKFEDYKESVIDLLKRVAGVSVKTMEIINQMPNPE